MTSLGVQSLEAAQPYIMMAISYFCFQTRGENKDYVIKTVIHLTFHLR